MKPTIFLLELVFLFLEFLTELNIQVKVMKSIDNSNLREQKHLGVLDIKV